MNNHIRVRAITRMLRDAEHKAGIVIRDPKCLRMSRILALQEAGERELQIAEQNSAAVRDALALPQSELVEAFILEHGLRARRALQTAHMMFDFAEELARTPVPERSGDAARQSL